MSIADRLRDIVGRGHVVTHPDVLAGRVIDHTGRYRGRAQLLVRPGSAAQVAAVLAACRDARARAYLAMSREPADIAAMRAVKAAFDPTGYLSAAVMFDTP